MPSELSWSALLTELLAGSDLSIAEASWAMEEVMAGRATGAQLGAFLVALRAKGETVAEIVGSATRCSRTRSRWPSIRWRSTSSARGATGSAR